MLGCGDPKCKAITAWLFLIAGILFILQDTGRWGFWGLNWYTVLFLIVGVVGIAKAHCHACQEACATPVSSKSAKKKRR